MIFVCQDAEHRRRFVYAADAELTGHLNHGTGEYREERYIVRDRMLFALESDIRNAKATAIALPPRHEQRNDPATVRHVPLPGRER